MPRYDYVLFDADNTLFDFDRAEAEALRTTLAEYGLPVTPETEEVYLAVNRALWAQFDRGEVSREWLVVERFARLTAALGVEADPAALNPDEQLVLDKLVASFRQSEKLQQHVRFLYAKGSVYHIENGNLLYHGAVPMTEKGAFAAERFEGRLYAGRALMDYCDERARRGYYALEGSAARQSGQDFLWYLWCGRLSPLFGRSAMTTFERLYVADKATHTEVKDPYYTWYNEESACRRILAEFGLPGSCHIINGHVPVQEKNGESPLKGGGRLIVIDGGFCRAYHEKTGIAGYTLTYSSRDMSLRTHQPFVSAEKAITENIDIVSRENVLEQENRRVLVEDVDEGEILREKVHDLKQLVIAYQLGWIKEAESQDRVW